MRFPLLDAKHRLCCWCDFNSKVYKALKLFLGFPKETVGLPRSHKPEPQSLSTSENSRLAFSYHSGNLSLLPAEQDKVGQTCPSPSSSPQARAELATSAAPTLDTPVKTEPLESRARAEKHDLTTPNFPPGLGCQGPAFPESLTPTGD